MKRSISVLLLFLLTRIVGFAQEGVSVEPVITPVLFGPDDQITVTYDVTGTTLASLNEAWAWVWIPSSSGIDAKYNVNPASSNVTLTDHAKFTKSTPSGRAVFTLTFKPSDFFTGDISSYSKMGILLKGNDWSNGKTIDHLVDFGFQVRLNKPVSDPVFVINGQQLIIEAETSVNADYELFINGISVDQENSVQTYSYSHTITQTSGYIPVKIEATYGATTSEITFEYFVAQNSSTSTRPAGIIPGINYYPGDDSKVTLCLWAPGKSYVYARGDFNNWEISSDHLLKRDGEYFWITLNNLNAGAEYAFQYVLDDGVFVADPYADKILDPEDQYIPASIYPALKPFPEEALNTQWYFNRVSVFQTAQQPYVWQIADFEKPAKETLTIYELLIRDFFDSNNRSYQNLIDTIGYFKRLGINAIELMPIMEFNGNDSWGYNPTFMFAPDKAYGTKNKLKEFVDVCHANGIAVILDIALNHQDIPNAYVLMDYDFAGKKPTAQNKWFNESAKHPYNVFFDMNHESAYTKKYVDTIAYHWLNEYNVDGFRFDLSKGFTQNARCGGSTTDEGCIAERDNSRIAILERMADVIWSHTPDALLILEHFAQNDEEIELANHGFMLWGNYNYAYNQNTMGYSTGSDFSGIYHGTRGWSEAAVVGYMESHDEERMMYRNEQFGRNASGHNTKSIPVALNRMKAAATMLYTIPGPKMLWQFGELGYDYSINSCSDGSINNDCRVSAKPVKWDYYDDVNRKALHDHVSDIIQLRKTYDIFTNGSATLSGGSASYKQIILKNNPYTTAPSHVNDMNAVVAVNFDVFKQNVTINFPHAGTWYEHYASGASVTVSGTSLAIELGPGAYKLYTDVQFETPPPPPVTSAEDALGEDDIQIFPNPTKSQFTVSLKYGEIGSVQIFDTRGFSKQFSWDKDTIDVSQLSAGLYILKVKDQRGRSAIRKLVKE